MELAEKFIWFVSFVKILMVFTSWFIKQRKKYSRNLFQKRVMYLAKNTIATMLILKELNKKTLDGFWILNLFKPTTNPS